MSMNVKKIQSTFSLQAKIILLTTGLLVICMVVFSTISILSGLGVRKKLAENEVRKTSALIATVHSMYIEPDWTRTEEYMDLLMGLYTGDGSEELLEVLYILVRDEEGNPRILKVNQELARKYKFNSASLEGTHLGRGRAGFEEQGFPVVAPNMRVITMPVIVNGVSRGTIETGHLVVRLNVSERYIIIVNGVALFVLCFVGVGIGAVMSQKALAPVSSVVKAMKKMEHGSLDVRVEVSGTADTRVLAEGFNSMALNLSTASEGLREKTEALLESEKKYRSLFESASDGILLLDGNGVCRDANLAAALIFGVSRGELGNTLLFDIIEPTLPGMKFKNCPSRWSGTTRIPGGRNCHVEAHLSSIDPDQVIAVIRDVTPWKEAEEAVRRAKRRQQNMVQNLPMGIVVVNNNLKVTECNRFIVNLLKNNGDENRLSEWDEFKIGFQNDFEVRVKKVLKTGKDVELNTVKYICPDGREYTMDIKVNMFQIEAKEPPAVLIVMDDISDRVKMEQIQTEYEKRIMEAQKMELIGSLAGRFAHDFNNILSVILGNAEFGLSEGRLSGSSSGELEKIKNAALQGQDLTMRLLSFVRKEKIQESVKNIAVAVDDAVRLVETSLPGNIIIKRIYGDLDISVKMDHNQLVQAFVNVLNNAREAMPNGGEILVKLKDVKDDDTAKIDMCQVQVCDTGKGIKSNLLHRVFDPFFTSKPIGEHTGLGLSTSLGIIENHGGHISINSTEGSGTEVDIFLPVADPVVVTSALMAKKDSDKTDQVLHGAETILVVDDNIEMLMVAEKILKKRGFNILSATDGENAIEVFKNNMDEINLIIMDMIMPGINGKKTLERISEIKSGVKALIMTGYSDEDETLELLSSGIASGYVQKPFRADQLFLTIREMLDGAKGEG